MEIFREDEVEAEGDVGSGFFLFPTFRGYGEA